jgi:hypothetical protein
MSNLWHCLEALSHGRMVAVPAQWQALAGDDFEPLAKAFLRPTEEHATAVPCPHECGCAHEVIVHAADDMVGICRCESWDCPDLKLQPADVELFELSWSRLGRGIARAFDCEAKEVDFKLRGTRQVAAFGAVGLPIVLTLRVERHEFRHVVAELMARLRRPFILLAPTNRALDGLGHELLANAGAGFFPLDSTLTLLPSGQLHSARPAGELFSPYLPAQAETVNETEAQRIFGLLQKLRSRRPGEKAPLHEVFVALVLEDRTQRATAERCDCSLGQIAARVRELELQFGLTLGQLRAYARPLLELERTAKADRRNRKGPDWEPEPAGGIGEEADGSGISD